MGSASAVVRAARILVGLPPPLVLTRLLPTKIIAPEILPTHLLTPVRLPLQTAALILPALSRLQLAQQLLLPPIKLAHDGAVLRRDWKRRRAKHEGERHCQDQTLSHPFVPRAAPDQRATMCVTAPSSLAGRLPGWNQISLGKLSFQRSKLVKASHDAQQHNQ